MNVRITHIGGPTTLIEVGGWRLLTDPTFDAPGRTYRFGYGSSSRKLAGPAIPIADIGEIDAVLLTHDHHGDNLDDAGRAFLPRTGVVVTTSSGARRLRGNARGLEPWATMRLEAADRTAIEITATPCRHGPAGSRLIVGDVIGFSLRWAGQKHGDFWITGDTVLFDGVRQVAHRLRIGTMLLHLGDVHFGVTGPVHYTLNATEAITLCGLAQPRTVIPVHYEGWSHFVEGRADVERAFAAAPERIRRAVRWVSLGEPADVMA
jgi:L-ascorbate metabolism protein UlaG (beta-lactamase superfamily)